MSDSPLVGPRSAAAAAQQGGVAEGRPSEPSLDDLVRATGLRATGPRRRVLQALRAQAHQTPDELAAALARDGGPSVPASTVYRALESLQQVGVVDHSHLRSGPATYHLAGEHPHLHVCCQDCGRIQEVDRAVADSLVAALAREIGFLADPTHMAIHGQCRRCRHTGPATEGSSTEPLTARGMRCQNLRRDGP